MSGILGREFTTLEQIYDVIPRMVNCKRLCWDSCGPVGGSEEEMLRARRRGYDLSKLKLPIFGVLSGTRDIPIPTCPALQADHRCAIYDDRPLICRLWGATERLTCTHGCRPERMLTGKESDYLLMQAVKIGGPPYIPRHAMGEIIALVGSERVVAAEKEARLRGGKK